MKRPEPGLATEVRDGIRRIVAANPGPMTHWGTNTWLLGEASIAVIDPGPDDPAHIDAILKATKGQRISHILITHAHKDHSGGAAALSRRSGAPILGYGPATAGRSAVMQALAESGADLAGGEGLDSGFATDEIAREGSRIDGEGWQLAVLHTPGHFAGHLAFRFDDVLFSGDHVMDWSTSVVSPPDGDVRAFVETCERLSALPISACLTGHGDEVEEPSLRLTRLVAHRRKRESDILESISQGHTTIEALTLDIYRDAPPEVLPAASRNVLAHLIDLSERNIVRPAPRIALDASFSLV